MAVTRSKFLNRSSVNELYTKIIMRRQFKNSFFFLLLRTSRIITAVTSTDCFAAYERYERHEAATCSSTSAKLLGYGNRAHDNNQQHDIHLRYALLAGSVLNAANWVVFRNKWKQFRLVYLQTNSQLMHCAKNPNDYSLSLSTNNSHHLTWLHQLK